MKYVPTSVLIVFQLEVRWGGVSVEGGVSVGGGGTLRWGWGFSWRWEHFEVGVGFQLEVGAL